jgi:hypothetical protein
MATIFPALVTMLFILAAIIFAVERQWNEVLYSISAALLQIAVYFKPFQH